jgi:hypothetical protein
MSKVYVECTTQAELDAVPAGKIAIVRKGFFVARGSSSVVARGSSSVVARESSSVEARGSSRVEAADFVAVHKQSERAAIKGGVVIDITGVYKDPKLWLAYHGIKPVRGFVTLYKAVDEDYLSGYGTSYAPGTKPSAPDWDPGEFCGNGLHFSPTPLDTRRYSSAPVFVACKVRVSEMVLLHDKVKAPRCTVLGVCDEKGVIS